MGYMVEMQLGGELSVEIHRCNDDHEAWALNYAAFGYLGSRFTSLTSAPWPISKSIFDNSHHFFPLIFL